MMKVKAILFDLGDTLLNYGPVDIDACFRAGAQLTYEYLQRSSEYLGRLGPLKRYHRRQSMSIKVHYAWSNLSGREFDCLALLDRHARRMGLRLERAQLEELAWLWYKPLGEQASVEPDLHRSLSVLEKDMGMKLAIVSNTFLPGFVLDRHLEEFDLLRFFPVRQYSSDTIYRKPDRRIYQRALEILDISGREAVMVGDKLREDVWGPARMGITGIFKRSGLNQNIKLNHQTPVIDTIAELPELIRKLTGR